MTTQLTLFDYAALDAETRIVVQQRTTEIKALVRQTAQNLFEMGKKFSDVQSALYNKRPGFEVWYTSEGFKRNFVYACINVHSAFKTSPNFGELPVSVSAIQLLAAPSTPESAREEALIRAKEGELITHGLARGIIHDHKNPTLPFEPNGTEDDEWRPIDLPPDAPAGLRQAVSDYYANEAAEYDHPNVDRFDPQVHVAFNNFGDPVDRDGMSDEQYHAAHHLEDLAADAGLEIEARPVDRNAHIMRVMGSSESPEWYTPTYIVNLVRDFFEVISVDPCSNSRERPNVPAEVLWTKEDDGLSQPWHGNVYMNPPYGDEIGPWVERMVDLYRAQTIDQAIALLPGRIDTAWFQPLYDYPMCNVRGRVKFQNAENSAPFPSVIVYLGADEQGFIDTFKQLGPIVKRIA